jgi:hypothetical protein
VLICQWKNEKRLVENPRSQGRRLLIDGSAGSVNGKPTKGGIQP